MAALRGCGIKGVPEEQAQRPQVMTHHAFCNHDFQTICWFLFSLNPQIQGPIFLQQRGRTVVLRTFNHDASLDPPYFLVKTQLSSWTYWTHSNTEDHTTRRGSRLVQYSPIICRSACHGFSDLWSTGVRKQMSHLPRYHQKVDSGLTPCHHAYVIHFTSSLLEGQVYRNKVFWETERETTFI